jgi:hypothetical protein
VIGIEAVWGVVEHGGRRRNWVWRRVRVRVRVRDSTVSPPVSNCVGGVSMRSPPRGMGVGTAVGEDAVRWRGARRMDQHRARRMMDG